MYCICGYLLMFLVVGMGWRCRVEKGGICLRFWCRGCGERFLGWFFLWCVMCGSGGLFVYVCGGGGDCWLVVDVEYCLFFFF